MKLLSGVKPLLSTLLVLSVLLVLALTVAACGTAEETTTSPAARAVQPPVTQAQAAVLSSTSTVIDVTNPEPAAAQPAPAVDGWTITLLPGTDKMLGEVDRDTYFDQFGGDGTISPPGPPMFLPSFAADGDKVVYTAFYGDTPQVYLYDISTGATTRLSNDSVGVKVINLESPQVQMSGDWVAWERGAGHAQLTLYSLATGETKRFSSTQTVVAWYLKAGRLFWQEGDSPQGGTLYLYDPAVGSVKTIAAAAGSLLFNTDGRQIAWSKNAWTELDLCDTATGQVQKIHTTSPSRTMEFMCVNGSLLAWSEREGDRTTVVVRDLDSGEDKTLDEFGPFNPEFQNDGRYLVWIGGESDTGPEIHVYDSKTGQTTGLKDETPAGDGSPNLDAGTLAWMREYPGTVGPGGVVVKDLATGLTTQLSNSRWIDQTPIVAGNHVVWARYNSDPSSLAGHGVFVATAPADVPAPAFTDLAPDQPYRTAIEWLGEKGFAGSDAGSSGSEFGATRPLLLGDFCLLLTRVLEIPVLEDGQALATLAGDGIVKDGAKDPQAPLTRGQAVSLLTRALDFQYPGLLDTVPSGDWVEPRFTDSARGEDVTRAGWNHLLDGMAGYSMSGWDISATATRGEAAQLLWNTAWIYLSGTP